MHLSKKNNLLCYYPLDEGVGTILYDQGYSIQNDLLWNSEVSDLRKTIFTSQYIQWKTTPSSVIFCDSNENLNNGRCVANHEKSLQLVRGTTTKFTIPIIEYQQDLTIEMWCNFNFNLGSYPYSEIIWQRSSSITLQLTVISSTSGILSFYPNNGNIHLDLALTILSTISGKWVHISFGQSSTINKSLLALINSYNLNVYQAASSAFTLTPGSLTLDIGSDSDTTALNALVKDIRIWKYYRGLGLRYAEAFSELLPYQYAGKLTGYWKLSESEGNTIRDFSENGYIATLVASSTRSSPKWTATLGMSLSLCGPKQFFKFLNKDCSNFDTPLTFNVQTNVESTYILNVGTTNPPADFTLKIWLKIASFYGATSQYLIIQRDNFFQNTIQYTTASTASTIVAIGPNGQVAFTGTPIAVGLWTYHMLTFSNSTNTASIFATSMDATSSFILTATDPGLYTTTGSPNLVIRVSNCQAILQSISITSTFTSPPYVKSALQ